MTQQTQESKQGHRYYFLKEIMQLKTTTIEI